MDVMETKQFLRIVLWKMELLKIVDENEINICSVNSLKHFYATTTDMRTI